MGELKSVDVVTEEVDVDVGPPDLHHQYATDAYHVGPLDDNQACGDVPSLVLPWAWEEEHEEEPVHPLLQTGTFGGNDNF